MNLVFLPATEPGDETCGVVPQRIKGYPAAAIYRIRYPTLVWYNEAIRKDAIGQIRSLDVAPVILAGFSKSGLGAWNIARTIPEIVSGTIVFDSPVAHEDRRQWGTGPFYGDQLSWQKDLPIHTMQEFQAAMPKTHRLVLISGKRFHDQMCVLSHAMNQAGLDHAFLPRPRMKHHWNSGWIEEGLNELL